MPYDLAKYEVKCKVCGEVFSSYDSYSEANEMLDGHMEADH